MHSRYGMCNASTHPTLMSIILAVLKPQWTAGGVRPARTCSVTANASLHSPWAREHAPSKQGLACLSSSFSSVPSNIASLHNGIPPGVFRRRRGLQKEEAVGSEWAASGVSDGVTPGACRQLLLRLLRAGGPSSLAGVAVVVDTETRMLPS